MKNYAIYLRKSRADADLERRGEGETLARHRKALTELADKLDLNVVKIYQEVVSGETIVSRPQMQELMSDVEKGSYAGVLVMEIERLARGDTIDQGLVAQTFKYSDTKIITPLKTYDPNNEFDEEFFEFGLFMSRREFKTINRRLKRGRYASAREGKWLPSRAPYGYKRVPIANDKGATLEPIEEQAAIVRMIFDWYVNGYDGKRLGIQAIAHKLNEMNIPASRHDYWDKGTIRDILANPVYAGKVRYGYRRVCQKVVNGKKVQTRPITYDDNCVISDGLHPAIISLELYEQVQEYAKDRPIMPIGYKKEIKNPLAGLVICKMCGRRMAMRRATTAGKPDYLVCHARSCKNVSSPLYLVEDRLITELEEWAKNYEIRMNGSDIPSTVPQAEALTAARAAKEKELATLKKQLTSAYDFLEQGIYTPEIFKERSNAIKERMEIANADIEQIKAKIARTKHQEQLKAEIIPRVKTVIQAYREAETISEKNSLLREILEKATYSKERSGSFRGSSADGFELEIYPKLPKCE